MSEFIIHHVENSFTVLAGGRMGGELGETRAASFDVTITDPPYSSHVHANLCSGSLVGKKSVPKYELSYAPVMEYAFVKDLLRLTRRWVVSFCDVEAFGLIRMGCHTEYVRGGIWYKKNAMGQLTKDRPATAYEGVSILHPTHTKKRWNGKGSYGIWGCNSTRGKKGRHPNEKPLDLALKLVALFSERGETVFDPFCGSGTIGEACVLLGRNYIGLDNDLEWVKKAQHRLELAERTAPVSDAYALSLCMMKEAA